MRRLLLVSYYFPPLAGSGVFRPLRLVKHLPRYGWEVTVLTASENMRVLKDPSLLPEVPSGTRVERTSSIEPRTALLAMHKLGLGRLARRIEPWLLLPDDQRGWVPFACRRAAAVLHGLEHHAVLTTSGPVSAHLVGLCAPRKGLPWVADFRDEWTTNPYLRYPTRWHRRLNRRLERRVLTEAGRVVCVSDPWLDNLRGLVPDQAPGKFMALPNGFDADHFTQPPPPPPERFRVIYTGTFYGHRSPRVFLEALHRVVREGRIPTADLEVVFVGHTANAEGLASLPGGLVHVVEQRPFFESLAYLREAAVLLLVIPREGGAGNHTGKLFNYLASGRPILALAPEGNVAANLIRETRSGTVAPPDDPGAVSNALVRLYQEWKSGNPLPDQDRQAIGAYEARPQAEAYARLLDQLL